MNNEWNLSHHHHFTKRYSVLNKDYLSASWQKWESNSSLTIRQHSQARLRAVVVVVVGDSAGSIDDDVHICDGQGGGEGSGVVIVVVLMVV